MATKTTQPRKSKEAKDEEVEVVHVHGSQSEDFLSISPRGKVPVLETPDGFISETSVILDYLETCGGTPLLPVGNQGPCGLLAQLQPELQR